MSREYFKEPVFYRQLLFNACSSEVEDLAEHAAGLLCAVAIFMNDTPAFEFITSHPFSEKQQEKICQQAASSFNTPEYHDCSELIIEYLVDNSVCKLMGLSQLFFDRCILIARDKAFLIHLMGSKQSVHLTHAFLNYLYESDENIGAYASVLAALGDNLSKSPAQWNTRLSINDLIKCVVRLFDKAQDDPRIKTICLDIWDNLFKSNLTDILPLSNMIDNFE